MDFVIPQADLLRELQTVTGVVEKRTTMPILANLLIEAESGHLMVGASDLEVTIRGRVPAQVRRPGAVSLPAGKLYEIARSLPEADVRFRLLDRHQVAIECERTRYRIAGQSPEEFPKFPEEKLEREFSITGRALREMIERVVFAITTEDPRYALAGALMLIERGSLTMVATDGHRLAFVRRQVPLDPGREAVRVLVPRKALQEVAKLAAAHDEEDVVRFGRGGNHVFFRVGESHVLSSSVLEGRFPNYEGVMPEACEVAVVVDRESLAAGLRRVSLLTADRYHRAVRVGLAPGELRLHTETELGEAQEVLSVDYGGPPLELTFNSRYLIEFLGVVGSPAVRVELRPSVQRGDGEAKEQDRDRPGQLRPEPPGEFDYRYIVMPMHV